MSLNPQPQCLFITKLPLELRRAVYLHLWRSCGLRQHIIRHIKYADGQHVGGHFCRWPCTTDFDVRDPLQEDARAEWERQKGEPDARRNVFRNESLSHRLRTPWYNHWACGDEVAKVYGYNAAHSQKSIENACFRDGPRPMEKGPYLPMLLLCKLISQECLESLYESTTFVFCMFTAREFIGGVGGTCQGDLSPQDKRSRGLTTPPGFLKHTRNIEVLLKPDFAEYVACKNEPQYHEPYDFHWLQPHKFSKPVSLKVWISARSLSWFFVEDFRKHSLDTNSPTQIGRERLRKLGSAFANLGSLLTVSTPLGGDIGPEEDGYVVDVAPPGVLLWKRGTGDRFHPQLYMPFDKRDLPQYQGLDQVSSSKREVRVGRMESKYEVPGGSQGEF